MIKVQKLNETAADAQKTVTPRGAGEVSNHIKPIDAWNKAKSVKQMDDAAAWGVNEITQSELGDNLQKVLKQGTLARFIQAISWKDLYMPNTFTDFLARNNTNIIKDIDSYLKDQENRLNTIDDKYIKSRTLNIKSKLRTIDDIFQLLYNGSLQNLYDFDMPVDKAITNCIVGKNSIEKGIEDKENSNIKNFKDRFDKMSDNDKAQIAKIVNADKDTVDKTGTK